MSKESSVGLVIDVNEGIEVMISLTVSMAKATQLKFCHRTHGGDR